MKRIPLTRGLFAVVDDEDYNFLRQWKWHTIWTSSKKTRPAAARSQMINGRSVSVQMSAQVLRLRPGTIVDHRNRDSLDDRKENLRPASIYQNAQNRNGWRNGLRGCYRDRSGSFRAEVRANGTRHLLGTFRSESAAALAYDFAARQFAVLNFPGLCAEEPPSRLPVGVGKSRGGAGSGYRGVYRTDRRAKPWRAMFGTGTSYKFLGRFERAEDAAHAYNLKAAEFFGDHAVLNLDDKGVPL